MSGLTCPYGHVLETKDVTGTIFGIGLKTCTTCGKHLNAGQRRHSCKGCGYHLCSTCYWHYAKAVPVMAMPSDIITGSPPVVDGTAVCKWGSACYNWDPEHRSKFSHAEPPRHKSGAGLQRRACKYGSGCYQKSGAHLECFVHPGDRNYRYGLVIFSSGQHPEFDSLKQLFQYYDPDESGHLSQQEFERALESCEMLADPFPYAFEEREQAWFDADGPRLGYVNFRQFVSWTRSFLALEYPLGLEDQDKALSRPCRFKITSADGGRCSCPAYEQAEGTTLCVCGHKPSMHRSEMAEKSLTKFLEESTGVGHWEPGSEGLVPVTDEEVLANLQALMTSTHKTTDNWTRDRGCVLHGVNGCTPSCASKNRVLVPTGYVLLRAWRNQNRDLWQEYDLVKRAIAEDCEQQSDGPLLPVSVASSGQSLEGTELDAIHNEWYLYHGTSIDRCRGICSSNFRLALAGSGATWKDSGKAVGTPLYGFGIYLAEHITKADEYAQPIPLDESIRPEDAGDTELHCVMLCRVSGGRTRVVTTNEFDIDSLRADVFEGPFNSVFGDRVSTLNKPFREIVVYDKDQCFPEFLLVYARSYD